VASTNDKIQAELGIDNAISKIINHHIFLNEWAKKDLEAIALVVEQTDPFVHVYTAQEVRKGFGDELVTLLNQGHQSRFSGDLVFNLQPNCIFYGPYGSTHGTGYTYDTHVPFLLFGGPVTPGKTMKKTAVTDIVDRVAETANLPYAPNSWVQ